MLAISFDWPKGIYGVVKARVYYDALKLYISCEYCVEICLFDDQ